MNAHPGSLTVIARGIAVFLALFATISITPSASAQTLVGNVFVNSFDPWTDTFAHGTQQAGDPPSWGTLLTTNLTGALDLVEDSDGRGADGVTTDDVADAMYTPFLLINTADVTPAAYNLTATLAPFDNDGFGVVFGYQDNDNYFRAGFREQANSSVGFPAGTSVQKVVGGVITQLGVDATVIPAADGTPFDVDVSVDGTNWSVSFNNSVVLSGVDGDLQAGQLRRAIVGSRGPGHHCERGCHRVHHTQPDAHFRGRRVRRALASADDDQRRIGLVWDSWRQLPPGLRKRHD